MSDDSYNFAVLDDFFEIAFNGLTTKIVLPFFGSLSKSLLLALVPAEN